MRRRVLRRDERGAHFDERPRPGALHDAAEPPVLPDRHLRHRTPRQAAGGAAQLGVGRAGAPDGGERGVRRRGGDVPARGRGSLRALPVGHLRHHHDAQGLCVRWDGEPAAHLPLPHPRGW